MIGDAIFHCHLYPHFHEGMWTLLRVFDRLEDGTGHYPDGTPIAPLMPLPDRPAPPPKDDLQPPSRQAWSGDSKATNNKSSGLPPKSGRLCI